MFSMLFFLHYKMLEQKQEEEKGAPATVNGLDFHLNYISFKLEATMKSTF